MVGIPYYRFWLTKNGTTMETMGRTQRGQNPNTIFETAASTSGKRWIAAGKECGCPATSRKPASILSTNYGACPSSVAGLSITLPSPYGVEYVVRYRADASLHRQCSSEPPCGPPPFSQARWRSASRHSAMDWSRLVS